MNSYKYNLRNIETLSVEEEVVLQSLNLNNRIKNNVRTNIRNCLSQEKLKNGIVT